MLQRQVETGAILDGYIAVTLQLNDKLSADESLHMLMKMLGCVILLCGLCSCGKAQYCIKRISSSSQKSRILFCVSLSYLYIVIVIYTLRSLIVTGISSLTLQL